MLVKNCQHSTITISSAILQHSYIVNTNLGTEDKIFTSTFTNSDPYCLKRYELYLFTGDANTNGEKDPEEYSGPIPIAGANANFLFYSPQTDLNEYFVNKLKPITNAEATVYYLKTRFFFDSVLTAEAFGEIEFTILPDCSIETITTQAIPNILYTFNAPAVTSILP